MGTGERQLLFGIATFLPGVRRLHALRGTGGTDSARYCYSVWLRHMVLAGQCGLNTKPETVAELGPGSSLGIGLAALLSGCERYLAFDVVAHARAQRNLEVFDELVDLFRNRAPIPDAREFPRVEPVLPSYDFPARILDEDRLARSLSESRLQKIRRALLGDASFDGVLQYKAPWDDVNVLPKNAVDMIFSQAVLEHVDDLAGAYRAMQVCLKSTGYLSHTIDFKCHGTAREWNGHWKYSDLTWKLIRGRRPYLINRHPHSTHVATMQREGFTIVRDQIRRRPSLLKGDQLAEGFRALPDDDLTASGAFIQAVSRSASIPAG